MKSNILNRFLAVVILAITVSCGQQTQSKLSGTDSRLGAEVSESASNLFVVLSGNGSCDKGGGTVIAPGLRENELFWAFDQWVMPSGLVKPSDNVLYACYDWQSPVMRLYDLRYRQQMIPINETELDGFVYAHARTARKIVIIGHSHADSFGYHRRRQPRHLSASERARMPRGTDRLLPNGVEYPQYPHGLDQPLSSACDYSRIRPDGSSAL